MRICWQQDVTTGASADFEMATKMARLMVTKYGMSSKLGAVSLEYEVVLARPWLRIPAPSGHTYQCLANPPAESQHEQ